MTLEKTTDVIISLDTLSSTEDLPRGTEQPPKTTVESQKRTKEPPKTTNEPRKTATKSPKETAILPKHGCFGRFMNRILGRNYHHNDVSKTTVNKDDSLEDSLFSFSWGEIKSLNLSVQIRDSLRENIHTFESYDGWLSDIELGEILAERISVDCKSFNSEEKDLTFLWSTFVERYDLFDPLYEMNANIHSTVPKLGYNALHLAAITGCVQSCEWLISKGLDLNLTVDGVSPLHCAILGRSLDCAKLLLSHGAALDRTVLKLAFKANAKEFLSFLLKKYVQKNSVGEDRHAVADRGMEKCVQIMLSYFPNVDLKITTPLHLAAGNNLAECCQFLIDGGADPNAVDNKGRTALHFAAKAKSAECLKILLKAGCKVYAKAQDGRTPLHMLFPTHTPALNALDILLKAGANVNASDNLGFTPLHLAAEIYIGTNDAPQCVDRLIMRGANVTARTHAGVSALSIVSRTCPGAVNTICRTLDSHVCLSSFSELSKEKAILDFDFMYLLSNSSSGYVSFLKTLESDGQKQLLEHPLCQAYLHLLWRNIQKFYFCRLFLWFVFVVLLTAYVIYALAHECYNAAILTQACESCLNYVTVLKTVKNISTESHGVYLKKCTNVNGTSKNISTAALEMCLNNFTIVDDAARDISPEVYKICLNNSFIGPFLVERPHFIEFTWHLLVIMAILESARKIWTTVDATLNKRYFFQLENIFEWFVILSVFLVSYTWYGRTHDWQKNIGGIAVLLAWADFMIMIGQLPIFGTYVAMFSRVQTEFFKLFLVYSCLLIGFTGSLCVFFPTDNTFRNPSVGFIKILAMMTGELDFGILERNLGSEASLFLNSSAYITYTVFLIFVTVVLMTLLTAITVHDIQGLHRTANISKLTRQMELIYSVERAIVRSYLPQKIVRFVWNIVWRRVVISQTYFPYNPREDGLPKEVLMAAINVGKQTEEWIGSNCCWLDTLKNNTDTSNQDEENVYEELQQLKDVVSKLVKNNTSNLSEEVFIKHEKNTQEELLELRKMVRAQNYIISKLVENNRDNLSEERFIRLERNLYKELEQLRGMVQVRNRVDLQRSESV